MTETTWKELRQKQMELTALEIEAQRLRLKLDLTMAERLRITIFFAVATLLTFANFALPVYLDEYQGIHESSTRLALTLVGFLVSVAGLFIAAFDGGPE